MSQIKIILGAPCSGKSNYVDSKAQPDDVRIDYDRIAKAIGSSVEHESTGAVRDIALSMRWTAIYKILDGIESDAWVIHTAPDEGLIAKYSEAGAQFIMLDTTEEECISRAKNDNRPEGTIEVIQKWFIDKPKLEESIKNASAKSIQDYFKQALVKCVK